MLPTLHIFNKKNREVIVSNLISNSDFLRNCGKHIVTGFDSAEILTRAKVVQTF